MKIPRMDTSRRPQKPGGTPVPTGTTRGPQNPSVELGSASGDDWVRVRVNWIAAPQGSHKPGFGKSVRESNPKTEPYRQAVADACEELIEHVVGAGDWVPLDGHLEVRIDYYMPPPPKNDPDRPYPNTAPDIDKLTRATFDGITRGRLWKDDARVVGMTVWEYFASSLEDTHVDIALRKVPGT